MGSRRGVAHAAFSRGRRQIPVWVGSRVPVLGVLYNPFDNFSPAIIQASMDGWVKSRMKGEICLDYNESAGRFELKWMNI